MRRNWRTRSFIVVIAIAVTLSKVGAQTIASSCAPLNGRYENLGTVMYGPRAGITETMKWYAFDGVQGGIRDVVRRESERNGISSISMESVGERLFKVIGTTGDGLVTDPYYLGSNAAWRCEGGAFVHEGNGELSGEGNNGQFTERFTFRLSDSGDLLHERELTIQRRFTLFFGMKTGSPEVTRRVYQFRRISL